MKRNLFIIVSVLLCCVTTSADGCFNQRLETGDQALNKAEFKRAIAYYEAAKKCVDAPDDLSRVNRKIANAKRKKEEYENGMSILQTEIVYEAKNNQTTFVGVTTRRSWSYNVSQTPYWLTVEQKGNGVQLTCEDNKSTQARKFDLIISNGKSKYDKVVHVEQKGKIQSYVNLSDHNVWISDEGGTSKSIRVYTDAEYFTVVKGRNDLWLDVLKSGSEIFIAAEKNKFKWERTAKIEVKTDDGSTAIINVTQLRKPGLFTLVKRWFSKTFSSKKQK